MNLQGTARVLRLRRPAAQFTMLPNAVLRSSRLSPLAKTLYALLRSYAWQQDHAFPGQQRLAREVPCSINTVGRGLRELVQHRLITVQRRGPARPNIYWLEPLKESTIQPLDGEASNRSV